MPFGAFKKNQTTLYTVVHKPRTVNIQSSSYRN